MSNELSVEYCLKFYKINSQSQSETKYVKFLCTLTAYEIDTVTFLLAEYFGQQHMFQFDRLTFFNQFKYVVDAIKRDYDTHSENDDEVKQIFKLFIDNDFIGQVPCFQMIMKNLGMYFKPIQGVVGFRPCDACDKIVSCMTCKANYLSESLTMLDSSLQDGWDIFFRPMLGIPVLFFVLFKTDMSGIDDEIFNTDNIITNTLLQFFYNLLSDKATSLYWNNAKCAQLINNCAKYVTDIQLESMDLLLTKLNSNTYNTKMFAPLKQFMEHHFSNKQISKLVHKIFIGFYMRVYADAKKQQCKRRTVSPHDIEVRNICRILFKEYNDADFERVIAKLANLKTELALLHCNNYVINKEYVLVLFNKYDLKKDVTRLLEKTVHIN
ncbi:P48/P45 [Epinotia aporema granulovirus]|uniref:p48/P45 n=1 Tax=Epinotia aporema granulovirus TaxID=166056 RepID=K4ER65_9BBAC|nr:P48/P45 [Epinotia aporema granulovirus]AER41504.1 P48/P45 [Epinotia aporema granulovirus]